MGQLGKLEMKFENEEKLVELKMVNIDPEIQFQIMELCMKGVHEEAKKKEEIKEKPKLVYKSGITETEAQEGYQIFSKPQTESNENGYNDRSTPRINTYDPSKSISLKNGVKHYQLFYICPDCGNKGKHYITPGTPFVNCHKYDCGREMMVRLATPKGLPNYDEWGNFYTAGEFKMTLKDKEDEEEFLKERELEASIN